MALFTASEQVSPFLSTNDLLAPRELALRQGLAADAHQNSLLEQQHTQQVISSNDIEQVARASQSLLGLGDEAKMAEAYPDVVRSLQTQGFAKNAPAQFPGRAVLERLAAQGTPSATLGERAGNVSGNTGLLNNVVGPGASAAPAGGGPEYSPDKATALGQIAKHESGGDPTVLNYVAQQDPTAYARGATASGKYQIVNSTWQEGLKLAGIQNAPATAREAPEAMQDRVASALWDKYGNAPWQKGAKDWVKDENGRYQMATVRPGGASAPGVQVAGPGAPTDTGTAPAAPDAGGGFTPAQAAALHSMAQDGKTTRPQMVTAIAKFMDDNRIAAHEARTEAATTAERQYQHGRNAEADRLAAETRNMPPGYRIVDGKATPVPGLPDALTVGKEQFNQENSLRDEFQKLTGDFRIVQTSYENIRSAAKANDGAGDMSMLYNYVRLLDPTSVVRESEFAAAAASGSFGQRVQGAVERVLSGARMPESLRQSFIREGSNLYNNQLKSHNAVADQYETLAKRTGVDPSRVVTRFDRPQDDATSSAPQVIRYDHTGKRIEQ